MGLLDLAHEFRVVFHEDKLFMLGELNEHACDFAGMLRLELFDKGI